MADVNLLKQIGERIYKKRRSLKMTQAQLAETVEVSTQMISNLECGKKAVRSENLVKICEALNISADYILMGSTSDAASDTAERLSLLSADELKIINDMIDYMNSRR